MARQKNKGVTCTQPNESLVINPESEPPTPEHEGEVSRALNQEKLELQLPPKEAKKDGREKSDNRPGAMLDKILARAQEAHQKLDRISPDVAARGEQKKKHHM